MGGGVGGVSKAKNFKEMYDIFGNYTMHCFSGFAKDVTLYNQATKLSSKGPLVYV